MSDFFWGTIKGGGFGTVVVNGRQRGFLRVYVKSQKDEKMVSVDLWVSRSNKSEDADAGESIPIEDLGERWSICPVPGKREAERIRKRFRGRKR